jgi:hypothetical protein
VSGSKPSCDCKGILKKIEIGHPDVVRAVWGNFPTPYEIDLGDEQAIKRLLAALVAAARVR